MVTLNATLLVELVLFLGFLWVLRRIVFRPLLALMDARTDKVTGDRAGAEADREAAERMKARYIDTLTRTNQEALQRLRHARLRAYQMNRVTLDELRTQADAEVVSFREQVMEQVQVQRELYDRRLPELVESMDRRINAEGSLL